MTTTRTPATTRRIRRLAILAATIVAFGVAAGAADAAITVTRSELNSSQLRIEGRGALPNATVVVNPGAVSGTSDSAGAFRIAATFTRSRPGRAWMHPAGAIACSIAWDPPRSLTKEGEQPLLPLIPSNRHGKHGRLRTD